MTRLSCGDKPLFGVNILGPRLFKSEWIHGKGFPDGLIRLFFNIFESEFGVFS